MSLYEKENFDRIIYFIDYEDLTIEEELLSVMCYGYASTINGEWVYYLKGKELWEKRINGNNCLVEVFETIEEAEHAQLLLFKDDLLADPNAPLIYKTKEAAESELLDYQESIGMMLN